MASQPSDLNPGEMVWDELAEGEGEAIGSVALVLHLQESMCEKLWLSVGFQIPWLLLFLQDCDWAGYTVENQLVFIMLETTDWFLTLSSSGHTWQTVRQDQLHSGDSPHMKSHKDSCDQTWTTNVISWPSSSCVRSHPVDDESCCALSSAHAGISVRASWSGTRNIQHDWNQMFDIYTSRPGRLRLNWEQ